MTDNVVSVKKISFAYDKHKVYEGFSLDIARNDLFFIMGVNGCGKTTLLKLIASFLKADKGEITVDSKEISQYDSKSLSHRLAYVPQTINLNVDFLVKDYLVMGRAPYKKFGEPYYLDDYKKAEKYASDLEIADLMEKNFNSLSGGQKQMVAICRALVQETPVIIMDEPMSALDLGKQAELLILLDRLKEEGKTIILTSHNPNHALALSEEASVCLLDGGHILGIGTAKEVLCEENIHKIFGDKVTTDTQNSCIFFKLK